jgi:1-acyl-sn-glycerol-3-phosphate acyltransferase
MFPALKKLYSEKGTLGILDWIYDKKRFFPAKIVLKALFNIFPYESLLRLTYKYDSRITEFGFSKSTRNFLDDLAIKVKLMDQRKFEGSCLIFGNHPTGLDPFIIASCLNRDDIYIVADVYQKNKGQHIGEHIIPIYYSRTQKNLRNRGILNSIGFYVMRIFTGYYDPETVKEKNITAIETAAKMLTEGHVVIIFPDGGSNNPELWYNGIGEIIKKADPESINLNLYATHISGISTTGLIRHFLLRRKKFLSKFPLKVMISPALSLESLHIENKIQSHEITEKLRKEFASNKLWFPNYAK